MASYEATIDDILVVCPTKKKSSEFLDIVEQVFQRAKVYVAQKEFDLDLYLMNNYPDLIVVDGKPEEGIRKVGEDKYVKVGSKTFPQKAINYAKQEEIPLVKASSSKKLYKKLERYKNKIYPK